MHCQPPDSVLETRESEAGIRYKMHACRFKLTTKRILSAGMHLRPLVSSITALVVGAVVVHAASLTSANELGTRHLKFRSRIQSDTSLRYIANSGICETTPGVDQYSGYIDVGTNMSMVSISRSGGVSADVRSDDSGFGSLRLAARPRLRPSRFGEGVTEGVPG